jgi:hypothetical protein
MEICRFNYFNTIRIPSSLLFVIVIFLLIWPNSIGKPTLLQAFAQDSTIDTAKLLAGDAIQGLNHKDLNGGLEHLKLIVQELGISGNSTSNSKLVSHLRTHIPAITSKQSALYTGSEAHARVNMTSSNATGGANMTSTGTITTPQNPQSSDFGYYFQKRATAPPPSYLTNTHTQKPILTCDQPGHPSCYSIGYSKGLLNTQSSCSAATLNSFVVANPSQVNNFCSGYRIAAQQALQQQR